MRRKPCYWTRKLELELVDFVRSRDFIWKPFGNTNHHIQQKYKAYAEFAAKFSRGITARSVRDRWVNIRSTFNHNLRKVDKSRESARSPSDVFVPCWPLWKPLQFLREVKREDPRYDPYASIPASDNLMAGSSHMDIKEEMQSEVDEFGLLKIRQRADDQRTDRPRRRMKAKIKIKKDKTDKCKQIVDDLVNATAPLASNIDVEGVTSQQYWFFGRHVTERLNAMREIDARCASKEIMKILNSCDEGVMDFESNG